MKTLFVSQASVRITTLEGNY